MVDLASVVAARRDPAGAHGARHAGRRSSRVPPPAARDGARPRYRRHCRDGRAARCPAADRDPRGPVVAAACRSRADRGRRMSDDCCAPAPRVVTVPGRPQIALTGNPNVSKTTLFNALTGSTAKGSNYPGITVERRTGELKLPTCTADLHDLPGTYSLNARSAEEQITLDALTGLQGEKAPDAVIVCVDATQIARSGYLMLQCRELGARTIVALTMVDEAGSAAPDPKALSRQIGREGVAVTARTGRGLDELRAAIDRALRTERRSDWQWTPSPSLRASLDAVKAALPACWRSQARNGVDVPGSDA